MRRFSDRMGFTFVEIVIATGVALVFFAGLIHFASATGSETSRAENYLRALQIAQETIELVQSMPVGELTDAKLQIFEGSLVDSQTRQSVALPVHPESAWKPVTKKYPEQYTKAYFYRKLRLEPLEGEAANGRFLRKLIVEVFWNEGRVPDKIDAIGGTPDRMRKLALATVLFDEREYY
ncbi:MAG TPA: hypothetical protein VIV61_13020 [Candidatus Ozemobacteraceae bacterium]